VCQFIRGQENEATDNSRLHGSAGWLGGCGSRTQGDGSAQDGQRQDGEAGKDAEHFTLTDAVMAGGKTAKSYDVMGGDLKAHVGHKVAVTGTLDAMTMGGKDKMGMNKEKMPMEGGMAKGKAAATEPHTMLHVTSVKMIAATCP
jgi:hypothetical protein